MTLTLKQRIGEALLVGADVAGVVLAGSGAAVVAFLGKLMLAVVLGAISLGFFLRLAGRRQAPVVARPAVPAWAHVASAAPSQRGSCEMKMKRQLWAFSAVYFAASLLHFAHNAEYIAFYPNMPGWLTREKVYLVWLAITGVGAAGFALWRFGWKVSGALCLAAYGAMGLDGLGHYSLALCSEHTLAMNLTIWFEAISGVALALCCAFVIKNRHAIQEP